MRKSSLAFIVTAVLLCALPVRASILNVASSADTYIDNWSQNGNFGTSDPLKFYDAGMRVPIFRFDFSAIPAADAVSYASMTFTFAKDGNQQGQMPNEQAVFDLAENFDESQANYVDWAASQPWAGAPGLAQYQDFHLFFESQHIPIAISSTPASYTVDVTPLITALRAQGKTSANVVLMVPQGALGGSGEIYSHRDSNPAYRPQLTVSYSGTAPIAVVPANYVFNMTQWNHQPVSIDGSASHLPDGSQSGLAYSWVALSTAPGSQIQVGQVLGSSSILSFNPDVAGSYTLQLTVTNTATGETGSANTLVTVGINPQHPRLGLNSDLINQIKQLAQNNDPRWQRFNQSVLQGNPNKMSFSFTGGFETSFLLGYLVTGDTTYFGLVFSKVQSCLIHDKVGNCLGGIYVNGKDDTGGLTDLLTLCGGDPHCAGFEGGAAIATLGRTYDWGYAALTPTQRQDMLNWLDAAINYDQLHNPYSDSYFRNDGAAITNGVGAAAYGTIGDSTMSVTWLDFFRYRWNQTVQALNIMGTGMGEGNEYGEAPTAYNLIQIANDISYASGENLFQTSPWFQKRLEYDAYAVYPSTFGGPGAPYPNGWPGTFLETTVGYGDGRWGTGWIMASRRANGLILCRTFPTSQECSDWSYMFRQPSLDQTVSPTASAIDLIYYTQPPQLVAPTSLSFLDQNSGRVYIRSDWSRESTWISIWAGPQFDTHAHLKKGAYEVFKHRFLLPDTGVYDDGGGGFQGGHFWGWYHRTVSSNGLLIGDPHESFSGFNAGVGCDGSGNGTFVPSPQGENGGKLCPPNDGGQRSMAPMSLGVKDASEWAVYNQVFNTAHIAYFSDNGSYVTVVADITNAYNNSQYTTPGNNPKVKRVWREWVYLRQPDILLSGDVVESTDPTFQKESLLHAADRIAIGGSSQTITQGGEYVFNAGQTDATIVVDNTDYANGGSTSTLMTTWDLLPDNAYLKVRALFPNNFQLRMIGGRDASDTPHGPMYGEKNVPPGHFHTHIKDYFVHDFSEGIVPNHVSVDWLPDNPQEDNTTAFLPSYSGGFGRWRVQVEPTVQSAADYFLNVMHPTMDGSYTLPVTTKLEDSGHFGVTFQSGGKTYQILFNKNSLAAPTVTMNGGGGGGTITPAPFTAVSSTSLTTNWTSTFPQGTLYYAQLSTSPSFGIRQSSNTYNTFAAFSGLNPNTVYYAQVATAAAGPFVSLGSTQTVSGGGSGLAVSISTPSAGSTVSGVTTVAGTASDAVAISSVAISIDAGSYSLASGTSTWSLSWNTLAVANGTHTVTAKAWDSSGNTAATSIIVTVNNASIITITQGALANPNPVAGAATSLTVSASDNAYPPSALTYTWSESSGPAPVAFAPNGSNAAQSSTATFTAPGIYALSVTVADPGGSVAQSSVTITVNQTLSAIAVSPSSATVGVRKTQQFATSGLDQFGGSMAVSPSWTVSGGGSIDSKGLFTAGGVPGGPYQVSAASGVIVGNASVSIVDNTPPSVAITTPTDGSQVTGVVEIAASASDDGSVAWVQFQIDGVNYGNRVTAQPYSIDWNTGSTAVLGGTHTLTAVAQDEAGNQAVSSPVRVFVKPTRITLAFAQGLGAHDGGGQIDFTQSQFVLEAGDPNFPEQPAVTVTAAMPSGSKTLTLNQLSQGLYSATVSSSMFSAQDFSQSGATVTVTANGLSFSIALNGDAISQAVGGVIVAPGQSAALTVGPGQLSADAQIALAPLSQGGGVNSLSSALSRQGLALLGPIQQLTVASSATLTSGQMMLSFDPTQIPRGLNPSQVQMGWYNSAAGVWQLIGNTGVSGSVMTAYVGQFGDYAPLAILPSSTPGPRSCYVYPNPAVLTDPTLRIFTGVVDSVEVTVFDLAGRAVRSGSASGAPTGIVNGDYYYDVPLGGGMASGGYFFAAHAKSTGQALKCRGKFSVVR